MDAGDDDPRDRPAYASLVLSTRKAFRGDGPLSRGEYLRIFRRPETVVTFRGGFRSVMANNPDMSRDEVITLAREWHLEFYEAVAVGAGLDPLELASLLSAVRKGIDLAEHEYEKWEVT